MSPLASVLYLCCWVALSTVITAVDPIAVYSGSYSGTEIKLRIGNGGAGQSGLIGALADAYIKYRVKNGASPFLVAWYESDTTASINYLQSDTVDVGVTYNPAAEQFAIKEGIAKSPSYYIFRDHFILAGPIPNPANISNSSDIYTIIAQLYTAAQAADTNIPVRFLSRYDKSATNIKDSFLWVSIGQVPWATPYSTWYHQYMAFPIQALTAAILLQEYTLTDRGTYLSLPSNLQKQMAIYKEGLDDESDPLLNPAHLLIGTKATNSAEAQTFAKWVVSASGQSVIVNFKKGGQQLYSPAPSST